MTKIEPHKIWEEYLAGETYHQQIELHDTVKRNEQFYNGEQWEGVNAPDLEKPVINIFKRAVTYMGSQIISDDIGINLEPFAESDEGTEQCRILTDQIERIVEITKAKTKNREVIRDAAVCGDGCFYAYFDPEKGRDGEIALETVDNEKVIFANPFEHDIQKQRYVILVKRMMVEDARERAKAFGALEEEANRIQSDDHADYSGEKKDVGKSLVTVLLKFWKENGKVWFCESCQDVFIRKPVETRAKIYHIAWMPWDKRKDSYHGNSVMKPYIPNQIYVNKMWALAMVFSSKMAWPQRFYDATKIKGGLTNRVGQAIGVAGDPKAAIWFDSPSGNMSAQVLELVDRTIEYTRQSLGVTDAALGDVKPDNTSALIAAAEQTAAPLIFQKQANHQLWEDLVHIFLDLIEEFYGIRTIYTEVEMPDGTKIKQEAEYDFAAVDYDSFNIKVNIGAASYWSQVMQVRTMDAFFQAGIVDDAILYLEHIPDGYISGKEQLIKELEERRETQAAMMPAEGVGAAAGNPQALGQLASKISGI
ncbi:MAG: hypothetical protein IKK14_06910 [Oscillospiraceae bacterium]|nr:hypothetical protein [Oscillospiraceae bacterium]